MLDNNFKYLSEEYKNILLERFNYDPLLMDIIDDLVLLEVDYFDFNNKPLKGTILCNITIYEDLDYIFKKLYENKYQIEKIELIDKYDFNDDKSMKDNNSSCFNFRKIVHKNKYSNHSYGLAIDINPLYNPYVVDISLDRIYPIEGKQYIDREKDFEHKITYDDLCYKLFLERGFEWGGEWDTPDYQHFQKSKK